MARKATIGSVTIILKAMVVTKRNSLRTLTLLSKIAASSGVTELVRLAVLAMTILGSVSGTKHMITTNPAPMIELDLISFKLLHVHP